MPLHATDRVYDRFPERPTTTAATKIGERAFFYEKIPKEMIVIILSSEQHCAMFGWRTGKVRYGVHVFLLREVCVHLGSPTTVFGSDFLFSALLSVIMYQRRRPVMMATNIRFVFLSNDRVFSGRGGGCYIRVSRTCVQVKLKNQLNTACFRLTHTAVRGGNTMPINLIETYRMSSITLNVF